MNTSEIMEIKEIMTAHQDMVKKIKTINNLNETNNDIIKQAIQTHKQIYYFLQHGNAESTLLSNLIDKMILLQMQAEDICEQSKIN